MTSEKTLRGKASTESWTRVAVDLEKITEARLRKCMGLSGLFALLDVQIRREPFTRSRSNQHLCS